MEIKKLKEQEDFEHLKEEATNEAIAVIRGDV